MKLTALLIAAILALAAYGGHCLWHDASEPSPVVPVEPQNEPRPYRPSGKHWMSKPKENEMAMQALRDFVREFSERGSCRCGRCVDHPGDDSQPEGHTVDMVFFEVAAKGNPDADKMRELIAAAKVGDFGSVDPFDGAEHSYIEVGGWIGDQGLALMFMGLGAVLKLWPLMTPKMLPGLPDDLVKQMAGQGMITIMPPAAVGAT